MSGTDPHSTAEPVGVINREVATTLVEVGAGYVARVGDMVLWAEPPPGRAGADGLDAAVIGLRDISARLLSDDQTMAQVSTLLTDARIASLAGLAALVPTSTGILSVAYGWGVVTSTPWPGEALSRSPEPVNPSEDSITVANEATVQIVHLNHDLLAVGRQDVTDRLAAPEPGLQPAAAGLVQGVVPGGAALVATRLTIADQSDGKAAEPGAGASAEAPAPTAAQTEAAAQAVAQTEAAAQAEAQAQAVAQTEAAAQAEAQAQAVAQAEAPAGSGSTVGGHAPAPQPSAAQPSEAHLSDRGPEADEQAGSTYNGHQRQQDVPTPPAGTASAGNSYDQVVNLHAQDAVDTQPHAVLPLADDAVTVRRGPPAPSELRPHEVLIEGILCIRGHLNDPLALHCNTCAISMIQRRSEQTRGVRPPLGILVLDDGATYSVRAQLILGTAPDRADAVADGRALGVPLADPAGEIEPLHAELRLEGWEVRLIDWSTSGTYLLPADATTWDAAPRGTPTRLLSGTRIGLGGRVATFSTGPA